MKKKLFLLIYLFFSTVSFSQQVKIDSLKSLIAHQPVNMDKAKHLSQLCNLMVFSATLNEAKPYLEELVSISKKIKNDSILSNTYQLYGGFYTFSRDLNNVEKYMNKAINLSDSVGDHANYILSISSLAAMYGDFNKNYLQLKTLLKGANYIKINKTDISENCQFYLAFGTYYFQQEKQDDAMIYFLKSMECADKFKRTQVTADAIRGLAWIYFDRKDFNKAETYLLEGIRIAEGTKIPYVKALLERILGKVYTETKNYTKALACYHSSLEFFNQIESQFHQFELPNNISLTHYRMGDYKKGLKYAEDAYAMAKRLNDTTFINSSKLSIANCSRKLMDFKKSNTLLFEVSKDTIYKKRWPSHIKKNLYESIYLNNLEQGNYRQAVKDLQILKNYEDSLNQSNYDIKIVDIETKYQTEKKEKENLTLKKKNAEQQLVVQQATILNQRYIFLVIAAVLGILGLFYYSKTRRRKLRDEHIINIAQTKQKEHEKIGADLHSTKAKDLEKIASNLEQKGEVEIAKKVREVKDSIRLLSHELFQIPFSQLEFDDQIINLLFDYNSDSLKITHAGIHTIPWPQVDDTIKRNLYLIISEAISNIKNHSQATTANVNFQKANKNIDVTITDNGIGFTEEDLKKGHGIGNMRMRVNEIKGSIRFDAVKNKGSEIGIFITAF
ncbi:MAG: hypothetical protein CML16_18155 [Pusillimonas sp.]|nr:hypothetical protein [Pusillimonas sp.]|tara:strand:+ start:19158 stop:21170 length:2013 start_codon:yes stop_codon:yes gene_type:complete